MKALLLVLLIAVSGCAFLDNQKANWDACKADAQCMADADRWKETGELVGTIAGSVVPGAAAPAQKIGGYAAFAVAMLILGAGIRKKREVVNV